MEWNLKKWKEGISEELTVLFETMEGNGPERVDRKWNGNEEWEHSEWKKE